MKTCAGNGIEDGNTSNEEVIISDRNKGSNKREYLTLKMVNYLTRPHHLANVEIHYRVKQTTQLVKVKKCFTERIGVPMNSLRFLYDGRRIVDEDTPGTLEMESGDDITVHNELGGKFQDKDIPEHLEAVDSAVIQRHIVDVTEDETDFGIEHSKKLKLSPDLLDESRENEDRDSVQEELERITRKHKDLVEKLRDKVECAVCFGIPKKAPVPVCPNGHVVCARCVRRRCPTCGVNMGQGNSTLAVTVIENIEHQCDNEGCDLTFALSDLPSHMSQCRHRIVRCPGLDCSAKLPMSKLNKHVVTCCFEGAGIKPHKLPQKFTCMMKKDRSDSKGIKRDFHMIKGLKFEDRLFFLKVTRKQRTGEWFFFVQMMGSFEDTSVYGVTIEVFRLEDGPNGKYSQRYSGDICPIDISKVDYAYDRGLCLMLQDGGMAKLLVKDTNSGNNKCSVLVDIFRA